MRDDNKSENVSSFKMTLSDHELSLPLLTKTSKNLITVKDQSRVEKNSYILY